MSTIVAPLTPVQRSAAILLRVSGPDVKLLFSLFNTAPEPRVSTLCRYISKNCSVQDNVLVTYFKAPNSYTGEDVLEISFHGNPLIVRVAVADMLAMGVRVAEAGEFTKRAYLNGKMTLSQAEAVNTLIKAHTETGVSVAKNTLNGALDKIFYDIRNELVRKVAELDAVIDFSEEAPEAAGNDLFKSVAAVSGKLKMLVDSYRSVQLAVNGVQVVIAGAPNVGKSTLFNTLVGRDRAIVSEEAGTTRDMLCEMISAHGINFALADTAGIRQSSSKAEQAGVQRTMETIDGADLLLVLIDTTEAIAPETVQLLKNTEEKNRVVLGTKCDRETFFRGGVDFQPDILISATAGTNIDKLKDIIVSKVTELLPKEDSGAAILAERQLAECIECIKEISAISEEQTADIQAYHLRLAVQALDRAQGALIGEQVLDEIFSRFCIGK